MNLTPPDGEIRYRPRHGEPRCLIETAAQWVWRWRVELVLGEIAVSVVVAIAVEFLRT